MRDVVESLAITISIVMIMLVVFGSIFGFFAYLRYLRYKEIVTLAEKGLIRPRDSGPSRDTLRWGIVITGIGIALCIGLYPFGWLIPPGEVQFPLKFGPWMLIGLLPTFFGLSLIVLYVVLRRENERYERLEAQIKAQMSPFRSIPQDAEDAENDLSEES